MSTRHTISIQADWSEIERVSSEAVSMLHKHQIPDDAVEALNMVICELVENSLKYGQFDTENDTVDVAIAISNREVTVEVINPLHSSEEFHLKRLDQTTQWIRGFQDPFQSYLEKLKEISKKPLDDEESGLGLARIAYEGQAILDFFVSEAKILNVSAVMELE